MLRIFNVIIVSAYIFLPLKKFRDIIKLREIYNYCDQAIICKPEGKLRQRRPLVMALPLEIHQVSSIILSLAVTYNFMCQNTRSSG